MLVFAGFLAAIFALVPLAVSTAALASAVAALIGRPGAALDLG